MPRMVWPGQSRGDPSLPGDPDGIDYHYTSCTPWQVYSVHLVRKYFIQLHKYTCIIHPRHTLTVQYPNYYIFSQPTPLSLNGIEKSTQKCPFTCLLAHCTQLTKIWFIALIPWMGYWWWYHTNNDIIVMSSEMFCNEIPFIPIAAHCSFRVCKFYWAMCVLC